VPGAKQHLHGRVCLSECMLRLEVHVYGLSIYLVFLKHLRLFRLFLYTFKTATQTEKFILSLHKKNDKSEQD
jgi:hypothetical protein